MQFKKDNLLIKWYTDYIYKLMYDFKIFYPEAYNVCRGS